jgi:hypothetical protein
MRLLFARDKPRRDSPDLGRAYGQVAARARAPRRRRERRLQPGRGRVATLDFAGVIRIWDACNGCTNPAALMALARSRVTRQLTDDERRTFGVN